MGPGTRIILATGAVALLHSGLASRRAKSAATRLVGERNRNAFYRPFYIAQSVLSFGGLILYIGRQPNRVIYRMGRATTLLFNLARLGALTGMVAAVKQIGVRRLTGLSGVQAWRRGHEQVPREPEAQGPALDDDRCPTGPFRYSRHPLNFLGLPLIWLAPVLTRNRLAFNLAASMYLLLGSVHEERRLRHAYGERYDAYSRGTRFLFGLRRRKLSIDSAEAAAPLPKR